MSNGELATSTALEEVPEGEATRIENTARLTVEQLKRRLSERGPPVRRGVHPKDHGCVTATFTVLDSLDEELRVGVFSKPGHRFDAFIRFSNADVDPKKADSAMDAGAILHGSRGMAVKLLGVTGTPLRATNLMTTHGPLHQDFLMINQPVFAFANVRDYEVLSNVLLLNKDDPAGFFQTTDPEVQKNLRRTGGIIAQIRSNDFPTSTAGLAAFQPPPVSPLDNRYFSAAAFLFGEGRAMKFSAKPVSPSPDKLTDVSEANYLRAGLRKRLAAADGGDIEFEFQVQVRNAESLAGDIANQIEDVCVKWPEEDFPFVTVAKISIPLQDQDIDSTERKALCEDLFFSPWNGLAEHRPLGGINRLRLSVYEASARMRHTPGACPLSAG